MAIRTKKSTEAQIKQIAERTKGMTEFIVKVDMNLDAPYLCSGVIMNYKKGDKQVPIIVTNLKEYSKFFTVDQLEKIKEAIERADKDSLKDINAVCPTAMISPVFDDISVAMLMNPQSGSQLMAMFLYGAFMASPVSRLRGTKTDIRNLAARTHVYFNRYPAGADAGTTIKMVSTNQIPHLVKHMTSNDVLQLVCLNESTNDITVSMKNDRGAINKIVVEPSLVNFVDDAIDERSATATSFFDMIVIFERLEKESEKAQQKLMDDLAAAKEKNKKLKAKLK